MMSFPYEPRRGPHETSSPTHRHIREHYPHMNLIVEPDAAAELSSAHPSTPLHICDASSDASRQLLARKADLAITLGGDGTILHVSSLFHHAPVPPVLSFSMGTLGFLLPYDIRSYALALRKLLQHPDDPQDGQGVSLMLRMRLRQTLHDAHGGQICSDDGLCKGERGPCAGLRS